MNKYFLSVQTYTGPLKLLFSTSRKLDAFLDYKDLYFFTTLNRAKNAARLILHKTPGAVAVTISETNSNRKTIISKY